MEYVAAGSTGTGLTSIGIGLYTTTEWCAILGVFLTTAGVLWGIHSSRQAKKVQAQANAQQALVLNTILEVLHRVAEKDSDRGADRPNA